MSEPKEFYKNYTADDNLSELSYELYKLIKGLSPGHVFEFGCGSGKNLKAFHLQGIVTCGLDISPMNIIKANARNDLPFVIIGNEYHLGFLANFDVVFTCSVLDHIENIDNIITEFKRIGKVIFLAETQHHDPNSYYYEHNYDSYGFHKLNFEWSGNDGHIYNIWEWRQPIMTPAGKTYK